MLKKGLCLLIGIMMLFCQINVVHATNLASGAESAILIDANSQQVLYHKNETKRLYPASTTKIIHHMKQTSYSQHPQQKL